MNITPPSSPTRLARLDFAAAALIACLGLGLYIRTLAPGLLYGDSAEFQTLAYTLGMTHPTGYPVYLLVAHLFGQLPLGNLAYRINLLSALFAALGLGLTYLDARLLGSRRLPAAGAALALGCARLFWSQAVIAELYTAASAWLAGILFLLLSWRQSGRWQALAGAGLLGGLSLGVHNTVALAAPAVALYLLAARARREWLVAAGSAALGLALALAAFFYIDSLDVPVSYYNTTLRHARSEWGLSTAQIDSPLERLAFLAGARQFRMFMFADPAEDLPRSADLYWQALRSNFAFLTLSLAALGLVSLLFRKRTWREGMSLILGWLSMLVFVLNYTIDDIQVFYIPTFVWLALAGAVGGSALLDGLVWALERLRLPRLAVSAAGAAGGLLLVFGMLTPQAGEAAAGWRAGHIQVKPGEHWLEYAYPVDHPQAPHQLASILVMTLEPDALVITDWQKVFAYYYVADLEQGRTGMDFREWPVQEGMKGLADSSLQLIESSLTERPVYFDHRPPSNVYLRFQVRKEPKLPWVYQVVGRKN